MADRGPHWAVDGLGVDGLRCAGAVENRTARLFVDGALVATAPFVEPSRSRREVRSSSARDRRG